MSEIKLKPCPFCGCNAHLVKGIGYSDTLCWVVCRGCGAESTAVSDDDYGKEKAAELWNRRVQK